MLKRTNGIILLILLVLTGLAGRLSSNTITSHERRLLIDQLKESKISILKSIKGLSEAQLDFKPASGQWSIKECLHHITVSDQVIWQKAEAALKEPSQTSPNTTLTDEAVALMLSGKKPITIFENRTLQTSKPAAIVVNDFKRQRAHLIQYAKTSTDDMRNHILQDNLGTVDAYQLLLLLTAHTKKHVAQIEKIKANSFFPKK